jgi:hypothetical protein
MNDLEVIETQQETGLTPITDDTLISLAEQAEKRIDAMTKIKRVAIKLTNRADWVDEGGRPYLQSSGATKIARMFGISWSISEPIKETFEDGHFSFTYKGKFSLAGATIEEIGSRSSRDGFFKRYSYENGNKSALPPSEIDQGDIKKAAYSNCLGRGITTILGIRNLTYEDLAEFAGITQDSMGRVDYKKKGKADSGIASEGAQEVSTAVEDVRKKEGKTKAGKPFVKFTVKAGGVEYGTFSETIAKTAKEAKEACRPVKIRYTVNQFGNDIESLVFADDGPKAEEGEAA